MSHDKPASPVAEGEIVAGKYRVARTLGVGGMGVVVAAVHVDLNQRVALKFLLPQAMAHPDLVARFGREARAAAQIQSEHVARVIDVGTLETGAPYMVMEYLEGQDLQQTLSASGALPIESAVGHMLQACEAIAEAHALGIVHRDLKPANIFLATKPNGATVVKVLDFGISKSTLGEDSSDLTKTGTMVGSPSYMAPEQFKAAKLVDVRADQWSLGVILYELITRKKPFKADTMAELLWVVLDQAHVPIRTLCPDVPAPLEAVIDRCLAKEPAARFANVADLANELAPYGPDWSSTSAKRTSHVLGADIAHRPTELPELPEPKPQPPAGPAPMPASGPASATAPDPAVTNAPWSQSSPGTPTPAPRSEKTGRGLLLPVALGTLVAGALVAGLVMTQVYDGAETTSIRPSSATSPFAPSSTSAAAVPAPAPPAPASAPPTVETAAAPSVHSAGAPREPARSRGDVPTTTSAKTTPQPTPVHIAAPPASAAPPKCKTVTYFDSDGMKHFKQECP